MKSDVTKARLVGMAIVIGKIVTTQTRTLEDRVTAERKIQLLSHKTNQN
jgi:hypothetical protein